MENWQKDIEDKIVFIKKTQQEQNEKLDKVLGSLIGNDITGEGGFRQLFKDHENRIAAVEKKAVQNDNLIRGIVIAWAVICTIAAFAVGVSSFYANIKK